MNRLKKVQGKKKKQAAIAAAEKQSTDTEKKPMKSIKTHEIQPQDAFENVAESVLVEEIAIKEVEEVIVEEAADEYAVDETVIEGPEAEEAAVDLLGTKDEDVIF